MQSILKIHIVRFFWGKLRKYYFINIKKQLKIWNGKEDHLIVTSSGDTTIQHNLKGLHDVSGARSLRIIKPLSVIETMRSIDEVGEKGGEFCDLDYLCDQKVLTIGPRTEGEIFCLAAYGFKLRNIRGLDLISYSPYIDIGDMHNMPYADNSYDVVISSCVLVYSNAPQQACEEIMRVCKDGGLICIAQDTNEATGSDRIDPIGSQTLFCDDYLRFFQGAVKRVFLKHELPERLKNGSSYTMSLIFQIDKSNISHAV